MLDEPYTRKDVGSAPSDVSGAADGSSSAWAAHVESVPSEQLWRAAVLAARQAAVSAAELRRALEARGPVIAPPESGASQFLA